MTSSQRYAIQCQKNRLNSAYSELSSARSYVQAFRQEVSSNYQSEESEQVIIALNQCMERLYNLMMRCSCLQEQFQMMERWYI